MESILSIIVDNTLVAASSVTILLLVLGVIWLKSSSAKSIDSCDDNFVNDDVQRKHKKGSKTRQKKVKSEKAKPSVPNGHVEEQMVVSKTTAANVPNTSDVHLVATTKPETAKSNKLNKEVKKQTKEVEKLDSSGEWTTVAAAKKKPKAKEGSNQKDATSSEEGQIKDECRKIAEVNENTAETRYQPLAVKKDKVKTIEHSSVKCSGADNMKDHSEMEQDSTSIDFEIIDPHVTTYIDANVVDEEQLKAAAASNHEGTKPVDEQTKKKKKKTKSSAANVETSVITGKEVKTTVDFKKPETEVKHDKVDSSLAPMVEHQEVKADARPTNAESVMAVLHKVALDEEVSSAIASAKATIVFDELGDDTVATMTSVSNKKKKKPRREN